MQGIMCNSIAVPDVVAIFKRARWQQYFHRKFFNCLLVLSSVICVCISHDLFHGRNYITCNRIR
eukprot:2230590-Ditylum_brightwellii.AAC.1